MGLNTLHERLWLQAGSKDTTSLASAGRDPTQKWSVRSSFDLPQHLQLDLSLRRLADLSAPVVPAYSSLDLHLAWQAGPHWELAVTGRNLLGSGHGEFTAVETRSEIKRSVYFKATARY